MKHLLSIFILLSSVSLAEANTTNLNCNYKNHYYRNWDMNEYGMTNVDEDTQPTINFTILQIGNGLMTMNSKIITLKASIILE